MSDPAAHQNPALPGLARSLASHLRLLSGLGCKGFDCSGKTLDILRRGWGKPPAPTREPVASVEEPLLQSVEEPLLQEVLAEASACRKCSLAENRTRTVFGAGPETSELMFVGMAPGAEEDACGLPFQGETGGLLSRIIGAMGLGRNSVYITNLIKCRALENRRPTPQEQAACLGHLERQISLIEPTVICTLGEAPTHALLGVQAPLDALRGRFHDYRGIPVMPTFHPAELLASPEKKRAVWQDMQAIMRALNLKV